jgi:hypothetical protein
MKNTKKYTKDWLTKQTIFEEQNYCMYAPRTQQNNTGVLPISTKAVGNTLRISTNNQSFHFTGRTLHRTTMKAAGARIMADNDDQHSHKCR